MYRTQKSERLTLAELTHRRAFSPAPLSHWFFLWDFFFIKRSMFAAETTERSLLCFPFQVMVKLPFSKCSKHHLHRH